MITVCPQSGTGTSSKVPYFQLCFNRVISAIIADNSHGQHGDHTIYSDLDSDSIEAIPEAVPHRNVDIALVRADKEGYVKTYIITPGTVFGPVEGPLVDAGVQHQHSVQVPALVGASVARKQAGYIGAGKNVWSAVSNKDSTSRISFPSRKMSSV